MNNIKVSPHFSLQEVSCRCGCNYAVIDCELINKLEALRAIFNKPINVSSWCRCLQYNKSVGGVSNSQHLTGKAADIVIKGISPSRVAEAALKVGFKGVGIYKTFTHVDVRKISATWEG